MGTTNEKKRNTKRHCYGYNIQSIGLDSTPYITPNSTTYV